MQRRAPTVAFGQVQVELPPGGFLQASEAAEVAIRRAVDEAIGDAKRIADLFAGCGTLSLPLAAAGRMVHALERDPAMLATLEQAAARWARGARHDRTARSAAHAAGRRRARALRCARGRSAARRCPSAGRSACGVASRASRAGLVQSGDLRPRCADPRRRRLALPLGSADRRLSVVGPDRAGKRVRPRPRMTAVGARACSPTLRSQPGLGSRGYSACSRILRPGDHSTWA